MSAFALPDESGGKSEVPLAGHVGSALRWAGRIAGRLIVAALMTVVFGIVAPLFAAETASLTRNQILSQAGVAVLSQANQLPSSALSLLGR